MHRFQSFHYTPNSIPLLYMHSSIHSRSHTTDFESDGRLLHSFQWHLNSLFHFRHRYHTRPLLYHLLSTSSPLVLDSITHKNVFQCSLNFAPNCSESCTIGRTLILDPKPLLHETWVNRAAQ
jgi:hypothetical protein